MGPFEPDSPENKEEKGGKGKDCDVIVIMRLLNSMDCRIRFINVFYIFFVLRITLTIRVIARNNRKMN